MPSEAFDQLPEEYLALVRLAEEEHGIDVVPLHPLSGGRTDAFVFLVSVAAGDLRRVDHLVLKLDRVSGKSRQTETERHRQALGEAPPAVARDHLAELVYEVRRGDAAALFYGLAGHSLQRVRTLASLESRNRLEALFAATHDFVLREWNAPATFERALHPRALLQRWLGYRLAPDGQVASFLREGFAIPVSADGLLVRGQVYPNPLAYGLDTALWAGARPIDALIGFQHGDLNIGNVMAEFSDGAESPTALFLIDLALYKAQMPLLYDLCYLEMSYLTRELDRAPLETWLSFVERFAAGDLPDPKDAPVELAGACAVLGAGRRTFDTWVRQTHPSLTDDLWGLYRLAAVAAGLNFCNKRVLPDAARLAALVYSAAHLKRYCAQFGVPSPVDVRLLYDSGGRPAGAAGPRSTRGLGKRLPVAPTPFIGRATEVASLKEQLADRDLRLMTLTGPGGIGKTRLALRAAAETADRFEQGVLFVDLAGVREVDAVLPAVARAIGVREASERPLLDEIAESVGAGSTLLLLDNFEQVTAAAPVLGELLAACPGLTVLATSREALKLRGERVIPVTPLALPGTDEPVDPDRLGEYDAVHLFVERARDADPAFEITEANAGTIAEICARLDGLPLAIELATARLSLFPPAILLDRLKNRLKVLRGGARDLPERQQTLRGAIDWSYELLGAGEKRLLALLSVFQGCTIEAAETVAAAALREAARAAAADRSDGNRSNWQTPDLPEPAAPLADVDVLDALGSLVDKSLLQRTHGAGGGYRLSMLETIREYAAERLEQDVAFAVDARAAHAAYYADLAQRQAARLEGSERNAALQALETDLGNLQTAWRHWVAAADLEQLHKLTDSLWLLHDSRGWYQATVDLITDLLRVLAATPSTPERIEQEIVLQTSLARALLTVRGYTAEVEEAYNRALALCEEPGGVPALFPVLRGLSGYYTYLTDFGRAVEIGERILALADRLDDDSMRMEGHMVVGYAAAFDGRLSEGLRHLDTSIAGIDHGRRRARRFRFGTYPEVIAHNASALVMWMAGLPDGALERAHHALSLAADLEHPFTLAYAHFHTGLLQLWRREAEDALEHATNVLEIAEEHAFQIWTAVGSCLQGAALAGVGRAEEGLERIQGGMARYAALTLRPPVFWPMLHAMHANVAAQAGRAAEGLATLEQAMAGVPADPRNVISSDLCRLRGELLLAASPNAGEEAEAWLRRALSIAQQGGAPMLALRAATSLRRLRRQQGDAEEGRRMLADAFRAMTEGFATADVCDAEALLQEGAA